MSDEATTEGDASSIVPAAQPPRFENPERRRQRHLDEVRWVLLEQGHHALLQRVLLLLELLEQSQFHDVAQLLNEDDDDDDEQRGWAETAALNAFHARLARQVHSLLRAGLDDRAIFPCFPVMVLAAAREAAGFHDDDGGEPEHYSSYGNGGFGAVPAPAAAVACLEKQTFRAGGIGGGGLTECSICFEDFVDGDEVSVMPCPSRGHQFHPGCIAKWLGVSNMCPLCRHVLC